MIKTMSGHYYDVYGGLLNGTFLCQWDLNYLQSQAFLIIPAEQEIQTPNNQQNQVINTQTIQQQPQQPQYMGFVSYNGEQVVNVVTHKKRLHNHG